MVIYGCQFVAKKCSHSFLFAFFFSLKATLLHNQQLICVFSTLSVFLFGLFFLKKKESHREDSFIVSCDGCESFFQSDRLGEY